MGKALSCKDLGSIECTWEGKADTEEELLKLAEAHGRKVHGMKSIPPEMMEKVKAAIRDV